MKIKLTPIIAILCFILILTGCNSKVEDSSNNQSANISEHEKNDINEYDYKNFIELFNNDKYDLAIQYWDDNTGFHSYKDSIEYYNYSQGMVSLTKGLYNEALMWFNKVDESFLDVNVHIDNINNLINVFNGIYKSETINNTYLCINNGLADFVFDEKELKEPRYYSRILKNENFESGYNAIVITFDDLYNDSYIIWDYAEDGSAITLKADEESNDNVTFNGNYKKIDNKAPDIK